MALCPILKAGTMLDRLVGEQFIGQQDMVRSVPLITYHSSAKCMKDECEWWENGCPAYPRNITEKI